MRCSVADRRCQCGQPLQDVDSACAECIRHTRRRLAKQPELALELELTMTRQSKMQPDNDGGRSAETPVPFAPVAAALIHGQRATLVAWCKLIAEEGIAPLPEDEIGSMAATIAASLPVLRRHEAAGELVAEIRRLTDRIIEVIDLPKNRLQFEAGLCPEVVDDGHCPGLVVVTIPNDDGEGTPLARCGVCKTQWTADQWLRMGHRMQQRVEREKAQQRLAESFRRAG